MVYEMMIPSIILIYHYYFIIIIQKICFLSSSSSFIIFNILALLLFSFYYYDYIVLFYFYILLLVWWGSSNGGCSSPRWMRRVNPETLPTLFSFKYSQKTSSWTELRIQTCQPYPREQAKGEDIPPAPHAFTRANGEVSNRP